MIDGLTIDEKRQRRTALMRLLYKATDGNTLAHVGVGDLSAELGWAQNETQDVVQYLTAEGLAAWKGMGRLGLTHAGVVEVEELEAAPDRPTQHFTPITTVTIQGDVYGQVQAGSQYSSQTQHVGLDLQAVRAFLRELKPALRSAEVDESARQLAMANLAAVQTLIEGDNPQPEAVRPLLAGLRDFAIGIASSGAYAGLLELAKALVL